MAAPNVEKIPGKFPGAERKNIPAPFQISAESRAHEDHPKINEDAMFVSKDGLAFGVFDGMGGEAGGQEASNSARGYLLKALDTFPEGRSLQQEKELMRDILVDANKKIWREKGGRPEGMNTTASVVRIWQGPGGERKAIVGNVGDSRVYIFRNGKLQQITLDDNLLRAEYPNEKEARYVQEKMNNTFDPANGLIKDEQALWRKRNILTQHLGKENISPRMHVVDLLPGDQLLICSDGISDNLTDMEMSVILSKNMSGSYAKDLTDAASLRSKEGKANHPRAKKDDMTAIVVEIPSESVYNNRQREDTPREKQKMNIGWKRGMLVPVKRNGGGTEYWPIGQIGDDDKSAIATRRTREGKAIVREISLDKIPSIAPGDISNAKSEDELYYVLERLGGIQGSQEFYSSGKMIDILRAFFSDGADVEGITEKKGLRKKAIELKENMQKMRAARRRIRSL